MMKLDKVTHGVVLQVLGVSLILCAVVLTVNNYCDEQNAEEAATKSLGQIVFAEPLTSVDAGETVIPDYILNPYMDMPSEKVNGNKYIGKIEIPALGLTLPVINEWSYKALKTAPCRYAGTVYGNNMIIAAHNYKKHFGNIKTLTQGNEVIFTDIDGNVFNYCVSEVETLQPRAIEEMVSGDWDLTLFTCTVGGQSRVTVRCIREN